MVLSRHFVGGLCVSHMTTNEAFWLAPGAHWPVSPHRDTLFFGCPQDDSSDHGAGDAAEAEMAITPVADDTPSGSATTQSSDPPPAEEQTHAMEVDDKDGGPPPASPVSPGEDDLLTGSGAVGVEGEMANLKVSFPKGHDGGGEDASI